MSTNRRGEELVEFLGRCVAFNPEGKRVLDVGCAYGGLSIALAKGRANVSGIDLSTKFIRYAEANARNTAEVDFHVADASSVSIRKLFEKGSFDLVVINDVLEHIYDTASLVANIDWLLNDTGLVYFKVPNPYSPRFVLSEGHRKVFGLTLLDPDCWFHMVPKRSSIFYRPLSHFQALFEHFKLPQMLFVDEERVFARFTLRKLKNGIKEIFDKARDYEYPDTQVRGFLREAIVRFRDEYLYDVEASGEDFVKFKYGSYFFNGFAGRTGADITPLHPVREIEGIGRIAERGEPPARAFVAERGVTDELFNAAVAP